ncbi:PQQ-binding-like beta-propeller repeat protein [Gordonia jinghuaiqii]|uniref:PQQ-binding-like beta-propeller repeat protein n=1 Tax=Gordonia jinghuaiqii TaxID=2758710 RepID=A0A7D7LSF5_9ACTN|nr:PQQ-binding-like beta-propeller repeat protein [Gordonia jinghuaiqii]MCR5977583.1 PQQ-binding-like beta-propeller repeat protein [Gordonia jinghuaiqii]QMT02265.1 PQQ-binding-like beta-propeller repeat protein [Gordonia jinghuaiqii]
MSSRSRARTLSARLPFGIGTVVLFLCAALLITGGVVLASGDSRVDNADYAYGELRDYHRAPTIGWTIVGQEDLPDYRGEVTIEVADTSDEGWLISYPSGLGRSFAMVDRRTGKMLWDSPVNAGQGDCAVNEAGQVGCAVQLGNLLDDGFYLVDDAGVPTQTSEYSDTKKVEGLGTNFLRVNKVGHQVSLNTPSGNSIWARTFAAPVIEIDVTGDIVIVKTADASQHLVNPTTGDDRIGCDQCTIRLYPTGVAVHHQEYGNERVVTYATVNGRVDPDPVAEADGLQVLAGPSTLPVLNAANRIFAAEGQYEVRDPARSGALWQISDTELSKANAVSCGSLVNFGLRDGSRTTYALADGRHVGMGPPPGPEQPILANPACVGSTGTTMIVANQGVLTALTPENTVAWEQSLTTPGLIRVLDGYIVVSEGSTLSLLRPN